MIHGTPGEDGTLLAYFDLLKIPYSSAPFYQMALTFNKRDCLSVAQKLRHTNSYLCLFEPWESYDTKTILAKWDCLVL